MVASIVIIACTANVFIIGLGSMPSVARIATLPVFTNSGGLPVSLPLSMPNLSQANVEVANQSVAMQHWSIPAKLTKKILDLKYVDMSELLPDSWRLQEESKQCWHHHRTQSKRGPVNDILLWLECYAAMVATLSTKFPHKMPELIAYQRTILRAHRSFIGEGWVVYDSCYRHKASVTKSLDWGIVDFTLYNETFTGHAKAIARCRYCSSEHHSTRDCDYAPDPD